MIVEAIRDEIDDRDYEMQEVLDDCLNYCYKDKLIIVSDSWKRMRVQLAGTTYDFNLSENLYYDNIERGFSAHDYLGLNKEKSVRAIGKISAIITAVTTETGLEYKVELEELTNDRMLQINGPLKMEKTMDTCSTLPKTFWLRNFMKKILRKLLQEHLETQQQVFDLTQILQTNKLLNNML